METCKITSLKNTFFDKILNFLSFNEKFLIANGLENIKFYSKYESHVTRNSIEKIHNYDSNLVKFPFNILGYIKIELDNVSSIFGSCVFLSKRFAITTVDILNPSVDKERLKLEPKQVKVFYKDKYHEVRQILIFHDQMNYSNLLKRLLNIFKDEESFLTLNCHAQILFNLIKSNISFLELANNVEDIVLNKEEETSLKSSLFGMNNQILKDQSHYEVKLFSLLSNECLEDRERSIFKVPKENLYHFLELTSNTKYQSNENYLRFESKVCPILIGSPLFILRGSDLILVGIYANSIMSNFKAICNPLKQNLFNNNLEIAYKFPDLSLLSKFKILKKYDNRITVTNYILIIKTITEKSQLILEPDTDLIIFEGNPKTEFKINSQLFSFLHRLKLLNLSFNNLSSLDCKYLSNYLPGINNLKSLNIGNNNIGDEGAEYLSSAIKFLQSLEVLDVSDNGITENGIKHISKAMEFLNDLKSMNISKNRVQNSIKYVMKSIEFMEVEQLYLLKTSLDVSCSKIIGFYIQDHMDHLRILNLSHNNLGDLGMKYIFDHIKYMQNLVKLDISYVNMSWIFLHLLTENFVSLQYLENLNLAGNNLNTIGELLLLNSINLLKNLLLLDIANTNINDEEGIKKNKCQINCVILI